MSDQGKKRLKGLVVAPFTPMNSGQKIDLEKIESQARLFRKYDITGVFVCGTTGESMSLTLDERLQIAEKWSQYTNNDFKLIVHIGHNCLSDAINLAQHAQAIDAYAVGAVAPNFFKPSSLTDLVDYCAELASAVPKLPFYYYHIPSMTSIEFAMAEFLRLADKSIPNLGGIKFTFENLLDYALCVQFDDFKYNILFGRDEILLSGLALGASCAVGSFYNYLIPVFKDIIKAFGKGDIYKAQRLQYWVQRFTKIYLKYGGNIATGKAMMKIAGLDCGPVRQPMKSLSQQQLQSLKTELADIGYHKYSVKIDPS